MAFWLGQVRGASGLGAVDGVSLLSLFWRWGSKLPVVVLLRRSVSIGRISGYYFSEKIELYARPFVLFSKKGSPEFRGRSLVAAQG